MDLLESTDQLSLAASQYNRYPGETASLYVRFSRAEAAELLQLAVPKGLEITSYSLPPGIPHELPSIIEGDNEIVFAVPLAGHFQVGQPYELQVQAAIKTFHFNHYLLAEARILGQDGQQMAVESIQIAVHAKGKYLKYLPELYESDDFAGRFLMLFESVWKPISQQIDQVDVYFDPGLTPESFIPWLASWIGMPVDQNLPPERVRTLLKSALVLYQCRGTLNALNTFLEIYTGGVVTVKEQRARNFVLGAQSSLGLDIALGKENRPNTVLIDLRVAPDELQRMNFTAGMYLRKMEEIIRSLVPAHVDYQVHCTFDLTPERNQP
jgi:phage tail-like protein